ncbi:MAG: carboxypeptidase-like regulatory domain-containing protein, partial [Blastocatellia bacterium]
MLSRPHCFSSMLWSIILALLTAFAPLTPVNAQDTLTGAFSGNVKNSQTGTPIPNALVRFINQDTQVPYARRSDSQGQFYQGLLQPGRYKIQVSADGFQTKELNQLLVATRTSTVVPLPV